MYFLTNPFGAKCGHFLGIFRVWKLFGRVHRTIKSSPIIKPILKTCSGTSNLLKKMISTHSKTLIGSSYKFCFKEPYFGSLNRKVPKYGHFWFFLCEKNVFDEPWGPLEVILSPNWYWKRVQGHQIDLGKRYQHIPKLWSRHSKKFCRGTLFFGKGVKKNSH